MRYIAIKYFKNKRFKKIIKKIYIFIYNNNNFEIFSLKLNN